MSRLFGLWSLAWVIASVMPAWMAEWACVPGWGHAARHLAYLAAAEAEERRRMFAATFTVAARNELARVLAAEVQLAAEFEYGRIVAAEAYADAMRIRHEKAVTARIRPNQWRKVLTWHPPETGEMA